MIDTTMEKILTAFPVLQKISNESFPLLTSLKILRLLTAVQQEYSNFETIRAQLMEKYGEKENGNLKIYENNNIKILPQYVEKCQKELSEILTEKITIAADKIDSKSLETLNLTPKELYQIASFIA